MAYAKYLNITSKPMVDDTVTKFNYYTKGTPTGVDIGTSTNTNIIIEKDAYAYYLPSQSYIYIEGQLVNEDGSIITPDPASGVYPEITLTNNFFPFMFSGISYNINDTEIERLIEPGQAALLDALLTRSNNYNCLEQGWALDTATGDTTVNVFTFSAMAEFTATDIPDGVIAKNDYRTDIKEVAKRFNVTNASNIVMEDADIPCAGDNPTRAEIVTALNNFITKVNNLWTVYVNIPQITDDDIKPPGVATGVAIRNGVNFVIKRINGYLVTRNTGDPSSVINMGYNARHDLLFNQIGNVIPPENAGRFSFRIPLSTIFNFCRYYDKVMFNCKHELVFRRQIDDYAIYKNSNYGTRGKIRLDKFEWYMPTLTLDLKVQANLQEVIENKTPLDLSFMNKEMQRTQMTAGLMEYNYTMPKTYSVNTPRYIVAVFQSRDLQMLPDKDNDRRDLQNYNYSIFNTPKARTSTMINVRRIRVQLNNEDFYVSKFPYQDFTKNFASHYYNEYKKFRTDFLGNNTDTNMLSYQDFINLYRIYVINVANNKKYLDQSACNISIVYEFTDPIPAAVDAEVFLYTAIYSERTWALASNGSGQYIVTTTPEQKIM